jgi:hypothetical protein
MNTAGAIAYPLLLRECGAEPRQVLDLTVRLHLCAYGAFSGLSGAPEARLQLDTAKWVGSSLSTLCAVVEDDAMRAFVAKAAKSPSSFTAAERKALEEYGRLVQSAEQHSIPGPADPLAEEIRVENRERFAFSYDRFIVSIAARFCGIEARNG